MVLVREYKNSKEDVFRAAERILLSKGPGALTIENLLKESKLSRGGFFYLFPSKDSFLRALLERYLSWMRAWIEQSIGSDPEARGRVVRAYLASCVDVSNPQAKKLASLTPALIELVTQSKNLLQTYRSFYGDLVDRSLRDDQLPKHVVFTLFMAMDCLWMGESLGVCPVGKKETTRLISFWERVSRTGVL
jgi:AcrR family transcriptional regulator